MNRKNSGNNFTLFLKKLKKHNGTITVSAIVLLILAIFLFADRGFIHFYRSYSERDELKKEIEALEIKNEALQEVKEKIEKDPKQIEKIAREKYKMKKKDEKVYQVETDKDK
jgi:cell division protein FtsB